MSRTEGRRWGVAEYEWLASTFDPVDFDAREWVALAREAGVRYITITARHHDGFSMFATDQMVTVPDKCMPCLRVPHKDRDARGSRCGDPVRGARRSG